MLDMRVSSRGERISQSSGVQYSICAAAAAARGLFSSLLNGWIRLRIKL